MQLRKDWKTCCRWLRRRPTTKPTLCFRIRVSDNRNLRKKQHPHKHWGHVLSFPSSSVHLSKMSLSSPLCVLIAYVVEKVRSRAWEVGSASTRQTRPCRALQTRTLWKSERNGVKGQIPSYLPLPPLNDLPSEGRNVQNLLNMQNYCSLPERDSPLSDASFKQNSLLIQLVIILPSWKVEFSHCICISALINTKLCVYAMNSLLPYVSSVH